MQDGKMVITWTTDDVATIRPDLTEAQCLEVLAAADHRHDASLGINWTILDLVASDLFGAEVLQLAPDA